MPVWYFKLLRQHSSQRLLQRALVMTLLLTLCTSALLDITPARAQQNQSPAFRVTLTQNFSGVQFLSALPDDLSHPDHARFTISNRSELWYSVRINASSDALKPVVANPGDDLVSQAMLESGLLMPSSIIPVNPDLSLFQNVTLESHFTAPGQQVNIVLDPFTFDAAAFDCVRLALMLVGQDDVAQSAGLFVRGAITVIVREFNSAHDLVYLVNDFVELLNHLVHGDSLLGPANAVFDDLLHIAGDASELGVLAAALGKVIGRRINLNPLKVVLGILDGAKYLTDLIRSFGAYLFSNGNYPTITLQSIAITIPTATAAPTRAPTATPTRTPTAPPSSGVTPGIVRQNGTHWEWLLRNSNNGGSANYDFVYASIHPTDIPVVGDWDGNGTVTPGIVRQNGTHWEWLLRNSNNGGSANYDFVYAGYNSADTPVVGDWDGNGTTTPGIVRRSGTHWEWLLRNSNNGGVATYDFIYAGYNATDRPVVGDWDGR